MLILFRVNEMVGSLGCVVDWSMSFLLIRTQGRLSAHSRLLCFTKSVSSPHNRSYKMSTRPSPGATTAGKDIWRPDDGHDLTALANSIYQATGRNVHRPEILDAIDASIDSSSDELRQLSLDIHGKRRVLIISCLANYSVAPNRPPGA